MKRCKDHCKEKGARFEGYCGYCGKIGHRQRDCWSRQAKMVNSVETDATDSQDVNPQLSAPNQRCQQRR